MTRDGNGSGKATCSRLRLATAVMIVTLVMPSVAPAQDAPELVGFIGDAQTFDVRYAATFCEGDLTFGKVKGYDTIRLADGDYLTEAGKPMLPAQTVRIAVPPGMAVTGVRVVEAQKMELAGEYSIFPAQPPLPLSEPASRENFIAPDAETYASAAAYPGELAAFVHQSDLAGQGIAHIRFCPVQYVPASKSLTLYTSISVVLDGVGGYECGDYLPRGVSERNRDRFERRIAGMVVNPEDAELAVSGAPAFPGRGVDPSEDYDYVIITDSAWESAWQLLADWKTKEGVRANIVTTDWIYSQYAGANNNAKIRAFVVDARSNWGTMFFLLGGDTDTVPHHMKSYYGGGEYVANDTYYADYDDDWICEVHVGRASVRDTSGLTTFTDKVLTYEKNPPLSNYAKASFFMGFDLDGNTESELLKVYIRDNYVPPGWTCRTEYDSEPGTHKSDARAALNMGHNLVNHSDHSSASAMGVGYVDHSELFYSFDMSWLTNGDRQSILYSLGCHPCQYELSTCIAESFVRNADGGGLAFIGNSRNGYYEGGWDDDLYSLRYDRYFFHSLFDEPGQNEYILGAVFSDHKDDVIAMHSGDQDYQYLYTGLTLLGDPELPVWTDDPITLQVTHDATLAVDENTDFPVRVTYSGSPVDGARVCLWKDGDVYAVEETSGGWATFGFTPGTLGTMYVTVTNHNALPYEGEAEVVEITCSLLGDVNEDECIDGLDIAGFVHAKLGQGPVGDENQACADYGGTLADDVTAFVDDLLE